MAEKLHVPSEAYDGPDPGDAGFYQDSINNPHFEGTPRGSTHEFPHTINGGSGPHSAGVWEPNKSADDVGNLRNVTEIPATETQPPEYTPGRHPISGAQARRNAEGFVSEWSRIKRSGNWN